MVYRDASDPAPYLITGVDGVVRAHAKESGRVAWTYGRSEVRWSTRVVVAGPRVVGLNRRLEGRGGSLLFALDYVTGSILWENRIVRCALSPTLLIDDPHVFLASAADVSAFRLENGEFLWKERGVAQFHVASDRITDRITPISLATPASAVQGDMI
jgi:outer membrane protein assembly factor BamB